MNQPLNVTAMSMDFGVRITACEQRLHSARREDIQHFLVGFPFLLLGQPADVFDDALSDSWLLRSRLLASEKAEDAHAIPSN